jgi:N-acetylmuramic acid 6-phosphate (MurNAc-6-P) etherase
LPEASALWRRATEASEDDYDMGAHDLVPHVLVVLKANVDKREASCRLREKNGIVRHALKG